MSESQYSQKIDNVLRAAGYDRTDYDMDAIQEYLADSPLGTQPYVIDIDNPNLPNKLEYKSRRTQLLDIRHSLPYLHVETTPDDVRFRNLTDGVSIDVSTVNADFVRITFGGYNGTALINFKGSASSDESDYGSIIYSSPRIIFIGGLNSISIKIIGSGGYCSIESWKGVI